jgi:hypothetical protein
MTGSMRELSNCDIFEIGEGEGPKMDQVWILGCITISVQLIISIVP